jgi:diguanylate cyclase (GGDEF)-like protein
MRRKDGSEFWCSLSGSFVDRSDTSKGSVWLFEDVTERKRAEQALLRARDELERRVEERTGELAAANAQLQAEIRERRHAEEQVRHLALHDALTGLPNRRLLEDRIAQGLATASRAGRGMAVMFVDLDQFKIINDTLGHRTGDLLLQAVAERLRAALRAVDTISRIGGDEFVVVLPEARSKTAAAEVAARVLQSLAQPHSIEGNELRVTPSIGISLYPEHGTDVELLINRADAAMYRAKQMGRANFQFFAADMMGVAPPD